MIDEQLKVLNVNVTIDPVTGGGTAARTIEMSCSLSKLGHHCSILALDIGATEGVRNAMLNNGVELILLPCLSRRFYIPSFALGKIWAAVKNADIVHLMGHWTLINVIAYLAIRYYRKAYAVCPAGALPLFGRSLLLKRLFNWVIGRDIIAHANGCIAITEDEKAQFVPYGVKPSVIKVIPNGIDAVSFISKRVIEIKKRLNLESKKIILFVGRLNHIKGPDLLLDAYLKISEVDFTWVLVFVGPDGGMLASLKDEVRKNNAEQRVKFIGYLGGADKSDIYHAAEFLVIPSRQEAMSIVALEAGITGTPVLLTEECGFNQVEDVGGGIVVHARVDSIRLGLQGMIQDDSLSLKGQKLRNYVEENYTWDVIGHRFVSLYQDLLNCQKSSSVSTRGPL